jgi:1-acyl-sn-glycerol-3-phosphate acyltransferase
LLEVVDALVGELHPGRSRSLKVSLHSALIQDLAIDSLARAELLYRIEREFRVTLSTQGFNQAETVADLLDLLVTADRQSTMDRVTPIRLTEGNASDLLPDSARTLPEVLHWHAERQPERTHLLLYDDEERVSPVTYGEFLREAKRMAGALAQTGLQPGEAAAIMLPTGRDYFVSFFGILLCGAVPLPVYPPARLSQLEDHLRRHAGILQNAQAGILITTREIAPLARLLQAQITELREVVTTDSLYQSTLTTRPPPIDPQALALLQYTSGSTGQPKGVMLSHANLLANIRSMGQAARVRADDVFVSWLPLYHDMGLIGAWLGSLYHGIPLVVMSPLLFLSRPQRWLWAIQQYRGTLSAAPNFGYELCLTKVEDEAIQGLDLSSWRLAFNGAEMVNPGTLRRFSERFADYGFRPEAMAPVYGLAESSVGLAFPPLGRTPPIDRIQRSALDRDGRALPIAADDPAALELAACGQPLAGHQMRIVDELSRELPERRVGRLQFQGPSATRGYYRNPQATADLFDGDWLDSGDLAYIAAGDVYLTGRSKDIIIRAGRNVYPHELEEAVGELEGVRKGCVAVFGSREPRSGTERLVIVAETRSRDAETHARLRDRIANLAAELTGIPADELILAQPHSVLKTSSGKIRRSATRDLFEQGHLGRKQRAPWLQVLRLLLSSLRPQWHRLRRALRDRLYAAYVWTLFLPLASLVWLLVALLPRLDWRWRLIRGAARSLLRLAGVKLRVEGLEHLPRHKPMVLVANHASYLDGMLLVAALPLRLRFVAKQELEAKLIPRLFLQRLGAVFVERFDAQRSREDFDQINRLASGAEPLLFFPEGTFARSPGLLPFRMGAFVSAVDNRLPVLPVAIRGSRSLLRGDSWFPHRSMVSVVVGELLPVEGDDWEAKLKLRDRARLQILKHCAEPDLAHENVR